MPTHTEAMQDTEAEPFPVRIPRRLTGVRHAGIIDALEPRRPIYGKTTAYGHFERDDKTFTWENADLSEILKTSMNVPTTAAYAV